MAFFDLLNGFRINGQFPIDSRFVTADETARLSIPTGALYEGLLTYQEDNNTIYVLDDISQANHPDGWRILTVNNISSIDEAQGTITVTFDDGTTQTFQIPGLRETNPIVDNSDGTYTFHFQGGANPTTFTTQDFEAKDLVSGTGTTVVNDAVIEFTRKDGTQLQVIVTDAKGDPGEQGESVFFVYADDIQGNGQSFTQNGTKDFVAFAVSQERPTLPIAGVFIRFVGTDGANFNPALFDVASERNSDNDGTIVTISYNSNTLDTFTVNDGADGNQIVAVYATSAGGDNQTFTPTDAHTFVNFVRYQGTTLPTLPVLGTFVDLKGDPGTGTSNVDDLAITGSTLQITENDTPIGTGIRVEAQVMDEDGRLVSSKAVFDGLAGKADLTGATFTGDINVTPTGQDRSLNVGTDVHFTKGSVSYLQGDTDIKKVYYDPTNSSGGVSTADANEIATVGYVDGHGGTTGNVKLTPGVSQRITQESGTVLDVRGSFDLENNAGDKSLDFSGTSGDIHLEHNSEVYTLVDKDQKKIYYDTTNTDTSFPTTGRAGKEIVIKDDLTLLADEITAIEIQRNSAGQTLEQWEEAGNSASTFVADSSNSLTEVSLANNLNLLANDSYSKMIVATENGNNYHFDLLRFQAVNGRLVLQTDNLVTRLANIDTAISNAGGDATKKEAATSTWQASLADQYVIGDEVTVVRNGNGLINDRRVYIRTNANPGATTTDPGAQTYAVQGDSDPFPNIYVSANGNWGLLRRTGIQWRVGQDYIEGDKITQIVDDLPQDYFVIKRHTSTSTSRPSDPGTVYVKNGNPDTGNNLNDIFQRPIESIELLTNVPNTVYEETDTGTQVTVGSVGDAAGNTTTFILGTNGVIQQGGLASNLEVGHLVGFTTTPNDFTTVADNGGNGFEVTIVETVTLGDGNDYTRVTVSGDLNLIAGSNNFLYRLAYQTTLVQAHQLNFNRGIEDTPLGGSNPNGLVEIGLTSTGVTAGNYTNTNLTVDEQGRITSASNGSASGGLDLTDYAVQTAYAVGDFVYHKGEIFRCHTAYTSPNASLEVFGPQNQPENWGAVTENINAIDTLAALKLLNTSAGTSATIRVGDYFAVQGDTEANRGLYIVTATDNSNPPSGGTEVTKLAGLGGASGGGAVRIATNGSGTATSVPAGGIAIVNATHQYYNVTTAAIEVPVQSSMANAITYFGTTNFLSWVRVGDADDRFSGTVAGVVHVDTGVTVSARLDTRDAVTDRDITIVLPTAEPTVPFAVGDNISTSQTGTSRTVIRIVTVEAGNELILDGHHASEFNNGATLFRDAAGHKENSIWTLPSAGATAYTQDDETLNDLISTQHLLSEQVQANSTAIAAFDADLVSIAAYQPQGAYLSGAGDITPSYSTDQVDRSGSKTGTGYANTGAIRVYHNGDFEILTYLLMPEGTNTDGTGTNAPDVDYVSAFEEQFKTEDIIGHALVSGAYNTQGFPHVMNTTLETSYDNGFGTGLKAYFLGGQYQGRVEVRFQGTLTPSQNSDRTFITDHSDNTILYDNYTSYQIYPTNAFWHNVRIADPEQIFLIKEGVYLLHEIADAAVPANVGKVLSVVQDQNRVDTFQFPAGSNLSGDLSFTLSRPPFGNVAFSTVAGATITNTGSLVTFDYTGTVAAGSFTATYATTGIEAVDNTSNDIIAEYPADTVLSTGVKKIIGGTNITFTETTDDEITINATLSGTGSATLTGDVLTVDGTSHNLITPAQETDIAANKTKLAGIDDNANRVIPIGVGGVTVNQDSGIPSNWEISVDTATAAGTLTIPDVPNVVCRTGHTENIDDDFFAPLNDTYPEASYTAQATNSVTPGPNEVFFETSVQGTPTTVWQDVVVLSVAAPNTLVSSFNVDDRCLVYFNDSNWCLFEVTNVALQDPLRMGVRTVGTEFGGQAAPGTSSLMGQIIGNVPGFNASSVLKYQAADSTLTAEGVFSIVSTGMTSAGTADFVGLDEINSIKFDLTAYTSLLIGVGPDEITTTATGYETNGLSYTHNSITYYRLFASDGLTEILTTSQNNPTTANTVYTKTY